MKSIKKMGRLPLCSLKQVGTTGIPLGQRMFLFLAVLLLTILLGVISILLLAGVFTAGLSENERFLENELLTTSESISKQLGQISLHTVELAKTLSRDIEQKTLEKGISPAELGAHPYLLEEIISEEFDRTLFELLVAKSSGVFLILDATINPALAHAVNSRAGLYIKNMEPNIVSGSSPNITIMRGFPGISRKKSLPLHAQWKLEFDISDAPYYHYPIKAAKSKPHLPLSRLYYWSEALKLPGTTEEVMLCTAPLIDSQGIAFGICGLEVSAMLFKLSHMPNDTLYKRLFCLLAPAAGDSIDLHLSLFAGGYSAKKVSPTQKPLQISAQRRHLYSFRQDADSAFLGLYREAPLYPQDSAFADQRWIVAVMLPKEDLTASVTRLNMILFSSLTLLVILGIIFAANLGNRFFIRPISQGLDLIKSTNPGSGPKTRIPEIDSLIDYLTLRDRELADKARQENLTFETLSNFLKKVEGLTPAEREVFRLYGAGFTAQQIAAKLYLSINTIKTHSKRIYMKLEVGSREEIILYVTLLREVGKDANL